MTTVKTRINITTEPEVEKALKNAAKKDGIPVAAKAAQLIQMGLMLEEDIALASLADSRRFKKSSLITHEQAWL
ncbi:MAG: hypothetical protein QY321_02885 [Patescibacteria group bacterium]|nr:MAG: hypothetical protein QY321_02885 [Patescibacteria group bacterium]